MKTKLEFSIKGEKVDFFAPENKLLLEALRASLAAEFSEENLLFLEAMDKMHVEEPKGKVLVQALGKMYEDYVKPVPTTSASGVGSMEEHLNPKREVNVPSGDVVRAKDILDTAKNSPESITLESFDFLSTTVQDIIARDSFARFLRTEAYKEAAAIQAKLKEAIRAELKDMNVAAYQTQSNPTEKANFILNLIKNETIKLKKVEKDITTYGSSKLFKNETKLQNAQKNKEHLLIRQQALQTFIRDTVIPEVRASVADAKPIVHKIYQQEKKELEVELNQKIKALEDISKQDPSVENSAQMAKALDEVVKVQAKHIELKRLIIEPLENELKLSTEALQVANQNLARLQETPIEKRTSKFEKFIAEAQNDQHNAEARLERAKSAVSKLSTSTEPTKKAKPKDSFDLSLETKHPPIIPMMDAVVRRDSITAKQEKNKPQLEANTSVTPNKMKPQ